MKIQVKQIENLVLPSREEGHNSSGYDVVALDNPEIVGLAIKDESDNNTAWKRIDYIQYKTGLFIAPQTDPYGHDYHTLIFPRSSVSKYNLVLANCIGLVDVDYRGELLLRFKYIWQPEDYVMEFMKVPTEESFDTVPTGHFVGKVNFDKIYKKGDKIGQLVAEVKNDIDWVVVADLSKTIRGAGGFGSREEKAKSTVEKTHTQEQVKDHKTSTSPLLDIFLQSGVDVPKPTVAYETAVKEREKQI